MTVAKTFAREISFSGKGVHSNQPVWIRLIPATEPQGLWFQNASGHRFLLSASYLIPPQNGTALSDGVMTVRVIEHLLAALAAAGIYHGSLIVSANAAEIPILSGNALPFWEQIQQAGVRELPVPQKTITLQQPLEVQLGQSFLRAYPAPHFEMRVQVEFEQKVLGEVGQRCLFKAGDDFEKELAGARTWAFMSEWEKLKSRGLGMGADMANAIGIHPDGSTTVPLHWPNELARHKALDLYGDLAVLGMPLLARIEAIRPGHAINALLVKKIYEASSV